MYFIEILKSIFLGLLKELQNGCRFKYWPLDLGWKNLYNTRDQNAAFMSWFNVVIQLGAILAVTVIYFNKLNPSNLVKSNRSS